MGPVDLDNPSGQEHNCPPHSQEPQLCRVALQPPLDRYWRVGGFKVVPCPRWRRPSLVIPGLQAAGSYSQENMSDPAPRKPAYEEIRPSLHFGAWPLEETL